MSFLDEPLLLVPMHVDALAVGTSLPNGEMFQWTNLAPNFAKLKSGYCFGPELVGDPFNAAAGLEPGIHLHFRLPRAFSRGHQQGDEPLVFPAVPNRWLVQRLCQGPDQTLGHKAWLIRSDAPAPDDSSGIPWPTFPPDGQTPVGFKSIGICTELTAPLDPRDEPAAVKLTVVGQGNPYFSAFYPACRSVLGFHDLLAGVAKDSRLCYLVTGWFSTAADDPLFTAGWRAGQIPAADESGFRARNNLPDGTPLGAEQRTKLLSELRDAWFAERQWTREFDGTTEPARLLCHGLVRGIVWKGEDVNYLQTSGGSSEGEVFPLNLASHEKAYQIAVGNTGAEALAALLVRGDVDQDLLTAFQEDLLGQPVTAAELQRELHDRRFDTVRGGTTFAIQLEADSTCVTGTGGTNAPARRQSTVIPGPLRAALQELNRAQDRFDRLAREVESCRWQTYALWYLSTHESRAAFTEPDQAKKQAHKLKAAKFLSQLDTFKAVLKKAGSDLETAGMSLADRKKGLVKALENHPRHQPDGTPRLNDAGQPELKYRLVASVAPPFHAPSDPVIAVGGPAMAGLNTCEPSGSLACRLSGQIVNAVHLQVPGGAVHSVTGRTLVDELIPVNDTRGLLDKTHQALLGEALLLDGRHAATIAGRASQVHREPLTRVVEALQDPASTAAQDNPAGNSNALDGRLPDRIATFNWQGDPWIPLLVAWEVGWQSDYAPTAGQPLGENLVTRGWSLDRGCDLVPVNRVIGGDRMSCQGWSILSPSASSNVAKRLKGLNESHRLIDVLESLKAQLHRLDGFNDALILQKAGMQVPPLDFQSYRAQKGKTYNLDPIQTALAPGVPTTEQRNRFRTVPDTAGKSFLPIRAGQLTLSRLAIVDAFGQTLKLPVRQINDSAATNASSLHPATSCAVRGSAGSGNAVTLRPRFTQPMRLRFDPADASADSLADDGAVCGWILPNYLEKNLTIYAANGKPLGALQQKLGQSSGTPDQSAFHWLDLPGAPDGGAASGSRDSVQRLSTIIENTHLRHFCLWVSRLDLDAGRHFSSLISQAIAATDQRVPDEDPGVSVLVGRPLALVRASLRFETAGLPAHRPELRADTGTSVPDLIDTHGFERVQWPVRLGDLAARNDGLIGVFKCSVDESGNGVITTGPFHPAWGQDSGSLGKGIIADQDFRIDGVHPLEVTMLMDPQARVHATTGALPRTSFELPPETAAGARRAREVFFQTAPVLGFSPTPGMPKPSDDYGEWSWAHRPDVTQWRLDPNLVEATSLAGFADAWPSIAEGWLKLTIAPVRVLSFWLREPAEAVVKGTRVHLAWSFQGAESLELVEACRITQGDKLVETTRSIAKWNVPPFPGEYVVTVNAETTYRLVASAPDAEDHSRDLIIKLADDRT